MKNLFKLTLLVLAILLPSTATAYDFEVDGIYYTTNGNEAIVADGILCSGDVIIPEIVTYEDTTYTVTAIGSNAFYSYEGNYWLSSITIPNTVTTIGSMAFSGCIGLTSITIPNSVVAIHDGAFWRCGGLTSIIVESGNPKYDSRKNCNALIETASNTLIVGCQNTTIPNSVITIGVGAFSDCRITSINIPNSVTTIGDKAFSNCSILNEVYSYITDPLHITMGFNVFSPYNSNRTLYVPEGTFEVYSTYSRWSDYFGTIVEMEFEPTAIAESIQLNVTTTGLNEGATLQLTAMVQPEDGTSKKMNWASSDPSVATVDSNGLVTTHSVGTVTITAMTTDGSNLSASCIVTLLPVGVKGDVNDDGRVNISDVSDLIDILLKGY